MNTCPDMSGLALRMNIPKDEQVKRVLQRAYPEWMTAADIAKRITTRQWATAISVSNVLKHMDCVESKPLKYQNSTRQYRYAEGCLE